MSYDVARAPLILALAFLVGSVPFGLLVSRAFFKRDLRATGSGNIGAANALRTLGRKAGLAVLALDALKGAAAVLGAQLFATDPALLGPPARPGSSPSARSRSWFGSIAKISHGCGPARKTGWNYSKDELFFTAPYVTPP